MKNFDILLKELMSEYENSGVSLDDFIKSKLASSGRKKMFNEATISGKKSKQQFIQNQICGNLLQL